MHDCPRCGTARDRRLTVPRPQRQKADRPAEQITEVAPVVKLKTAKVLGVTFPLTLLGRADEVIG